MLHKKYFLATLIAGMVFILSACGTPAPAITVEGQWGRPSPMVATAGAFYMTIHNNGAESDKLVSVQSKACGTAELHESYKKADGVMGMRPVAGGFIEIPAGGATELKVGGLHIMCINKLEDFVSGVKIPVTLKFEKFGDISLEVEISEQ
ncbi:MAG: copper chaperone PCu(A)C [Chloroflexi bacterium]|nr:copper chaperone PCu(A)C [Chloroflexota bacterium]